jgi:hypothetical protein
MAKNKGMVHGTDEERGEGGKGGRKKTECPISRQQFEEHATPLKVTLGSGSMMLEPRSFSTGSLGWFNNEKLTIEIDGVPVKVQCNVNFTVVGSKDLPK